MKSKLFQIGIPDYVRVEAEEGTAEDAAVQFHETEDQKLEVLVTAETSRIRYVKLRWQKPAPKKAQILGDAWERGYGDLQWMGLSSRRTMPWYFLVSSEEEIAGYGVMVRPSSMCFWQMDTQGITLVLDVRSGGRGVKLNGRTLPAATVIAMEAAQGMASFEAAQEFCHFMCEDPIFSKTPVYGSNNWYYAYGESSEREIMADTDYILKLTEGTVNPPFMVIDDCWQEHRTPEYIGGPWKKGNAKFPDMKKLADQLKEKGVRPGIWVRFLLNIDPEIPEEWRLKDTGILDPSVPEVLDYIKEDVRRISRTWGYELIKHDFSTYDLFGRWGMEMKPSVTSDGWCFHNQEKTSAEIVKDLYTAICDAAKETDTIIIGCNTIGHLGAGLMHVNRTGDDTSGLCWERTRQMGINTLAFRLPQHKAFYDVDADCVGIAGDIPWFYNRQWADVIAESGTPLFVSAKPGVLSEEENEELHQIMVKASRQDQHKIPLDWEQNDTPELWGDSGDVEHALHYIWYRPEDDIPRSRETLYKIQNPL